MLNLPSNYLNMLYKNKLYNLIALFFIYNRISELPLVTKLVSQGADVRREDPVTKDGALHYISSCTGGESVAPSSPLMFLVLSANETCSTEQY